ncbi:DUF2142 domain-containing protein [Bifidobacterium coryneforme]|uniref:DUF2142 domain-containing protein n=1 Tax=Bifidobacterium coryneforme TaxID=1687 RepID=UPI0004E5D69D|nr:DUF2142 domain-containing protein [Bifidobacterium coryneforme]AII74241.1 hypothetical protein BCOR_0221 [Bifidobacterium coryneforme]
MGKQTMQALKKSRGAMLFFLAFALLQGSFFITTVGALSFPDPNIHAYASYSAATGQILNKPDRQIDAYGNSVKIQQLHGDPRFLSLQGCQNALVVTLLNQTSDYDPKLEEQKAVDGLAPGEEVTVASLKGTNRANQYFPAVFLPQAIGIWIGLHTHQSPYQTWQLGRISNLVVYILLFCLAIAIIPRGKMFLAVIGALPHGMFIASSLMADALFISLCAVFIALFMAITTRNKPASRGEMVALSVLTVLLFMCKTVYASLAVLILVLPRRILSTKRKTLCLGSSALAILAIYGTWSSLYSTVWAEASVSENLRFVLRHPLKMCMAVAWNFFIRGPLHLLKLGAPSVLLVIILGLAWGVLFHNSHPTRRKVTSARGFISLYRYQIASALAFLLLIYLAYASMMLTWNNLPQMRIGDPIQGIQARYFEPFLPLLVCTVFHPSDEDITDTEDRSTESHKVGSATRGIEEHGPEEKALKRETV